MRLPHDGGSSLPSEHLMGMKPNLCLAALVWLCRAGHCCGREWSRACRETEASQKASPPPPYKSTADRLLKRVKLASSLTLIHV